MSINMDGGSEEYADYEVQTIGHKMTADDGENPEYEVLYEPVYPKGLDSDELAELVGFFRSADATVESEDASNQTAPGDLLLEANMGINLNSKAETPTDAFTNAPTAESDSLSPGGTGQNFVITEPGVIDHFSLVSTAGFAGSDGGGGGISPSLERTMTFPDKFGTGPFVDRTDDIAIRAEHGSKGLVSTQTSEILYTLYWRVHEMPEGRASFARP